MPLSVAGQLHFDHAADRVAAEQCSLRAAKDLEAFEVEAVEQLAGVGADEDAVDDDALAQLLQPLLVRLAPGAGAVLALPAGFRAFQMPRQLAAGLMYGHWLSIPVPDIDACDYLLVLGAF